MNVGIIGIGGLGQMGVMLAKAMGNTVTAISTSPNKEAAAREIGADNFVVSTDPESMKKAAGSLDLILNTVSQIILMMTSYWMISLMVCCPMLGEC